MDDAAQQSWDRAATIAAGNRWTANSMVGETIYHRMTAGSNKWWLGWLLEDYFKDRKFTRVLSPGCGSGEHEMIIARSGKAGKIDAFDASSEGMARADKKAKGEALSINFYQDDLNTFTLPKDVKYDLIFSSGALHHTRELERFFDVTSKAISREGYFVLNEYVGPCYYLYPPEQVAMINRLLNAIPAALKISPSVQLAPLDLQAAIKQDASESVRSSLILPFLSQYFDVELRRDYGGSLLHVMYPMLNHDRFTDFKMHGVAATLRLLLEFEQILMENKILASDFSLCICRPKKAVKN